MSEEHADHLIDFKKANSPEIKKAFRSFAPPEATDINAKNARTRMQTFMNDNQLLLTMHAPTNVIRDFYHPDYAEAALAGIGKRPNSGSARKEWEQQTREQLSDFAATPDAHELIADSIGKFYHEIGKRALLLDGNSTPYIRLHGDKPNIHRSPLDYFGLTARGLPDSIRRQEYYPGKYMGKIYLPMNALAENVDWTIPGVESPRSPVRDMIWERLEESAETIADPQSLFALSSIRTSRGLVRAGEMFDAK